MATFYAIHHRWGTIAHLASSDTPSPMLPLASQTTEQKPEPAAIVAPDGLWERLLVQVHPSTGKRVSWAVPIVAIISLYYVFMASAGTFRDLTSQLDYYDQMAEGFRHGHLYIQRLPLPALLATRDPYADSNRPLWVWDACLYKGHYYLYWGPVPGLFLLAYKVLVGTHERITDQWPTTLFILGRLFAGAALILSLASRARIRQPAWITTLAIAVFGLANPVPFIVARPHVYEASLAGGQCFLFCGLLSAFWAIEKRALRRRLFVLAGTFWALALGCRATAFVAVPPLVLICAGFAWYTSGRSFKSLFYDGLALGLPIAAAVVAYGAYNYARFDSVTEFGVRYQVTLQHFYGKPEYVIPNIFSYLFAPVRWSCRFPFVNIIGYRALSPLIRWPQGYLSFERVGGIMITATWCWLSVVCVARVCGLLLAPMSRLSLSSLLIPPTHEMWGLLCSAAVVLSIAPVLPLWEASMRYAGDAIGGIVLAATLGVFALLRATDRAGRLWLLLVRGLVLVLGIQTCVIGALCGVTSTDDPLKTHNPIVFHRLEAALSFCAASR